MQIILKGQDWGEYENTVLGSGFKIDEEGDAVFQEDENPIVKEISQALGTVHAWKPGGHRNQERRYEIFEPEVTRDIPGSGESNLPYAVIEVPVNSVGDIANVILAVPANVRDGIKINIHQQ